ncbi:GAF domain-containing protein [Nocardioides sp. C4-1]|uniref:GAF domain-containing protein n=1 Tax=Nocardioides sp. C4-1 TaxID=3151851 RepID=UPI0032637EE7
MTSRGATAHVRLAPPVRAPATATRIRSSWERCTARGLPHDVLLAPPLRAVDGESRLLRAAGPVLDVLDTTLVREPVGVLLTDPDGVVLARRGHDRGVLDALDAVCLVRGATASEDAVGTSGVGLALADGRPAVVVGDDHYLRHFAAFTCAGAPVVDDVTGRVLGAVGLATPSGQGHELLLALAGQTALAIAGRQAARPTVVAPRRPAPPPPGLTRFEQLERDAIAEALCRQGDDVGAAAADLGLSRATLYRRIRRYGLRAAPGTGVSS